MTLSEELMWRGFLNQTTFSNITELDKGTRTFYFGMDPSAESLTIGNLAALMMVRHFIDHGYKAILLFGGATGRIGDPDGKAEERKVKPIEEVEKNVKMQTKQVKDLFAGKEFITVNNYDWFKDINYIDFLREVGKNFSMTQLLDRKFVKDRIGEGGSGISYAEFSYNLMQGYDFLYLFRKYGVTLQVCGADQWGNCITGVELIKKLEKATVDVYSVPLIIDKVSGRKFGKSEGNAVWLDPNLTSVFKYYQFWLNADDIAVEDYLKIYTLITKEELDELMVEHKKDPKKRLAQKALAKLATEVLHGSERTKSVMELTDVIFSGTGVSDLSKDELDLLAKELAVAKKGVLASEAMVETGLAKSLSEARRLIKQGGVSFNGKKLDEDINLDTLGLLKKGKNSICLVR